MNDAVLNGNIEILKFLLDKHENFFYASVSDCALSNAAINGHTEVVKFLLNRCSDLFDESVLSNALYDAASRGYTKIIRLLLNKGAEPSNYTLKIAVEKGYTEIVGLLLKNSGDLFEEKTLSQALSKAVEKGHKKIVELLLDHGGVNPNFQYWENVNISKYGPPILRSKRTAPMLISALEGGYADVAKLLLNKLATLFDESVLTDALNYAAEKGYTEIAKLLLDKGANPNGGVYALETAFKKEYMEMVTFLVKKNVRPSHFVLGLAAKNGHRKIVELLLDKWIDIFDEAILSYTLSNAVKGKDISSIELLLDKGADPDKTAPYGDTSVLSEAAQNGCTEIVRLFLKKGANPDIQDGRGYTALMYAAESGHIEVVKLLTENEIIDLILRGKNKSSMTDNALEGLVVHGGVDLNLRNGNGYTALTLAENKGHTDIARWLRNFVE